ncbi:unnamed protein product [Prorocentrum cordatum]|uniref:Uncharacterized protein n=1 Tax=Prorocentrum cordatum TaxID=2364126 RepID=A0ABN9QM94_9DINO|nr:unnamed protein product [Polarella glacialis]
MPTQKVKIIKPRSTRSLSHLRQQVLRTQRDIIESDPELEVIPEYVEEAGSEIEMNWDQTPDPWVDTELQRINFEEEAMAVVENPAVRTWRRWSIKMALFLRVCAISRQSAIMALRVTLMGKVEDEQSSCSHPLATRWSGGNQHGHYSKCKMRDKRLASVRKTKENIEEARLKMKREKKLKKEEPCGVARGGRSPVTIGSDGFAFRLPEWMGPFPSE